jgi:hypothetical protein
MALYAQTTGTHSTNSGTFVAIPGLSLTLPGGAGGSMLVILNLPNPFATGNNFPGATFGISAGGVVSPVQACFTSGQQSPSSSGRMPTTLVVSIPLTDTNQTITAMWYGVRGSTVAIDSPATLTAMFG